MNHCQIIKRLFSSQSNEKTKAGENVIHFINFFTIIAAVIVAIALPGSYFLEDAIGEQSEVEALATLQAAQITKVIKKDPSLWPLNRQQLLTLIEELRSTAMKMKQATAYWTRTGILL